jgi:hypothetical protein
MINVGNAGIRGALFLLSFIAAGAAWSAPAALEERSIEISQSVSEGVVAAATIKVGSANGGPGIVVMEADYRAGTILQAAVSLVAGEGAYKLELLNEGKPTLVLESKAGKLVKGKGSVSVNTRGNIEYRVTAGNAKAIVIELSLNAAGSK